RNCGRGWRARRGRRARDRGARLRRGSDRPPRRGRRAREPLRDGGEAAGRGRRRHRHAGGPVRADSIRGRYGRSGERRCGPAGAGPNNGLPTGGTARSTGELSVYTFLRVRAWLRIEDRAAALPLIEDAIWLGRAEGLEAHARAAERRMVEEPVEKGGPARGFPTP